MASQKCYLGYINHPNTKGWDGAKAIPPSTANNICQVSARLYKVSPCVNLSESEVYEFLVIGKNYFYTVWI
jgi:hypothetical protein